VDGLSQRGPVCLQEGRRQHLSSTLRRPRRSRVGGTRWAEEAVLRLQAIRVVEVSMVVPAAPAEMLTELEAELRSLVEQTEPMLQLNRRSLELGV